MNNLAPLISTKWSVPRISSDLVPRSHLILQLNASLDRKLTAVCAPAGYGKTTLICQWLGQSVRPVAWLSLDENDNELNTFLRYFIASIQSIFPESCQATRDFLNAPQAPSQDVLLRTLVSDLAEGTEPFCLVLDDLHVISDHDIHRFIEEVIKYMPPQMHLTISSRKDLPLPLVRLRVGRELTEIRTQELRFNQAEVKTYIEEALSTQINDETLQLLEERTEGWIAALRLAAIALRSESDPERYIHGFKGSHRNLMNYLGDEVLTHQQNEVQAFLLETSILNRFSAPLCAAVTNSSTRRCQQIINQLEDENLFVIPLDDEHSWYRYHHLFREMLLQRLQREQKSAEVTSLHQNAGLWLGNNGYVDEAIRHFNTAGNTSDAIELIDRHRHALLDRSDWRVLERWLSLFPKKDSKDDPSRLVAQSWLLLHTRKLGEMNLYLRLAEERLDKCGADLPESSVLALRAEIDTMRSYYWNVIGDNPKKGFECAERALKNLPPTHSFARGMALDFVCFAQYFSGRTDEAARRLSDAAYDPTSLGPSKLQTFIGLCHLKLISGDLTRLLQTASDFLEMALEDNQGIGIVYAHYFIGYAKYESNELNQAAQHLSRVAEMQYGASTIAYMNSMYTLALTYQALGETEKVEETIDALQTYILELNNDAHFLELASILARLSLLNGDRAQAARWAERVNPAELKESPFVFEVKGITWSSVQIALGTEPGIKKATDKLEQLLAIADRTNIVKWMIRILANLALAYESSGRTEEGYVALKRAITLSQDGGFIRTFLELGAPMSWMLRKLLNQGFASQHIKKILIAFSEIDRLQAIDTDDPANLVRVSSETLLIEPLTHRESEILIQLAERHSNKEIADQFTISIFTVKKHTTNIYQKLGVNNREQAVAKARILGLLH